MDVAERRDRDNVTWLCESRVIGLEANAKRLLNASFLMTRIYRRLQLQAAAAASQGTSQQPPQLSTGSLKLLFFDTKNKLKKNKMAEG